MEQKDMETYFKDEGRIVLNTLVWHCQLATYGGYLIFNIDKLEVELCDIKKNDFVIKPGYISTQRIVPDNVGEIFIVDGIKYDIHLCIKSLENLKFNESDTLSSLKAFINISITASDTVDKEKIIVLIPQMSYKMMNQNEVRSETVVVGVKCNGELLCAPKIIYSVNHYYLNKNNDVITV